MREGRMRSSKEGRGQAFDEKRKRKTKQENARYTRTSAAPGGIYVGSGRCEYVQHRFFSRGGGSAVFADLMRLATDPAKQARSTPSQFPVASRAGLVLGEGPHVATVSSTPRETATLCRAVNVYPTSDGVFRWVCAIIVGCKQPQRQAEGARTPAIAEGDRANRFDGGSSSSSVARTENVERAP